MDSEFFSDQFPLHFDQTPISSAPNWPRQQQPLSSSAVAMQLNELNSFSDRFSGYFFNPMWEQKSTDQSLLFDSAASSIVSSSSASNSNISTESFMIRELIGKLGKINSPPPKLNMYSKDRIWKPVVSSSSVAELTSDPGFAEQAALLSRFGDRSFAGKTYLVGLNSNVEMQSRLNDDPDIEIACKLPRILSDLCLQADHQDQSKLGNSSSEEQSSVSEQNPAGEIGFQVSNELKPKKRKAVSQAKSKETQLAKNAKAEDNSNRKRKMEAREDANEKSDIKIEEEKKGNEDDKENKKNTKSLEPPKDYIHVRARRGQATDSHSLAERVRREKISERMKFLQNLVPGCNKVSGKALLLDEIINYVQSLQRRVEFLSMKLASVDINIDNTLLSNDMIQKSNQWPHQMDSSAPFILSHQSHPNFNFNFPPIDAFNNTTQLSKLYDDDLQSIVQMGFGQLQVQETLLLQGQNFHGAKSGLPHEN